MAKYKCWYREQICEYVLDADSQLVSVKFKDGEEIVSLGYWISNAVPLPSLTEETTDPSGHVLAPDAPPPEVVT
jgi:hypothetical protein